MIRAFITFLLFLVAFHPFFTSATLIPNDTLFYNQGYLKAINAQDAWSFSSGSGVVIAFLDSGIDIDHPDLRQNMWINVNEIPGDGVDNDNNGYIDDVRGWDFVDGDNNPNPDFKYDCIDNNTCNEVGVNHGTIVAGVAAARGENNKGILGIAYNAKIMPLRVLNDNGVGSMVSVIRAINYAIRKNVDVINLSLVGTTKNKTLEKVLNDAHSKGIVVVAASGNDSSESNGFNLDNNPLYPVCEKNNQNFILGVGAIDENGKKSKFSNYGSRCIDISTIGEGFYSTQFHSVDSNIFSDYYGGWWSGTSVATALVSGTAALIKSINNRLTPDDIIELIINHSSSMSSLESSYYGKMGHGKLDVYNVVRSVADSVNSSPAKYSEIKKYLLVSAENNNNPVVKLFNITDDFFVRDFMAYNKNFQGDVNVAVGDLTGDGISEIITGAGVGGGPHIRVFDQLNRVKSQFFAYDENFRGGVNVAVGDLTGDGISEIITGAGVGGVPIVKVFTISGDLIFRFLAYDENFRGGVNVAVGDVDGDGISDIITGAASHGGPHIRVFDRFGRVQSQFFAYDENFRGGVNVAVGDVDGDGISDIITGAASHGDSTVKIFDVYGSTISSFLSFSDLDDLGVNISSNDINNDGTDEVVVAPIGVGHDVKIFNIDSDVVKKIQVFDTGFNKGINVAIMNVYN